MIYFSLLAIAEVPLNCLPDIINNVDNNILMNQAYDYTDLEKGIETITKNMNLVDNKVHIDANWFYMNEGQSEEDIHKAIQDANTNFDHNNMPLQFNLAFVKKINENDTLDQDDCNMQRDLYTKYGNSSKKVLNIFSGKMTANNYAFSKFPQLGFNNTDGIYIGDMANSNVTLDEWQKILTHEIGHWLGLFHTYQGKGCSDPLNDYVNDTPVVDPNIRYQIQDKTKPYGITNTIGRNWKCNTQTDTCPNQPGEDLTDNFMDFTNCRKSFTDGQRFRMMNFLYFRHFNKIPHLVS